jgi:hypothetical protein
LSENWHSDSLKNVQLTLSQGKKKKGDEVADDDNDDVVRTSESQDGLTATLCKVSHISKRSTMRGRKDTNSQHNTFSRSSLVSQLPARPHCG